MTDGSGNSSSRPGSGRPPTYVPSYDAPTSPLPKMTPEQARAFTDAAHAETARGRARAAEAARAREDGQAREAGSAPRREDDDPHDEPAGETTAAARQVADADTARMDAVKVWAVDAARAEAAAARTADEDAWTSTETAGGRTRREDAWRASGAAAGQAGHEVADRRERLEGAGIPWRPEAGDAGAEPPDDGTTTDLRRSAGAFPRGARPPGRPAGASRGDGAPSYPPIPDAPRRAERPSWLAGLVLRVGDVPIRVVYGIGATLATALVVVLIFALFSGDRPEPVRVDQAQGGGSASGSGTPAPRPIAVPPVPAAKAMTVFPAPGSPIVSYVTDTRAGISYARYGTPWSKASRAPFSAAQKAGPARRQAFIASAPVPVSVAKTPATQADVRRLAARAARWTLRYQPAGSRFTWTASQPARYNLGWMVGYKVTYTQDGVRRASQAYVMVIATNGKKPAMLFANVPDNRKGLYRDLNMLFWTARAL
ncbi:hypothetical protein [Sphaerisporangium sp. TRM90804]|uniref:hypothetical protein n=1 Tax=Sphaerisporangium sp. TRM90804 TaxID=3031113 RepID=UPI00244D7A08|nr:hypothetical protein [Sphaerisporangium sp. TRM90804]MDH2427894.1 hypothetical protein [Sphaerisporangium sp. TRM90804]